MNWNDTQKMPRSGGMAALMNDVADFHFAGDQPVRVIPALITDPKELELRDKLLKEEVKELDLAIQHDDLEEVADALADIIYVVLGTAHCYGIPMAEIWAEVQRSNMAKADPETGKMRKNALGKIMKPEGWTAPNIEGILTRCQIS